MNSCRLLWRLTATGLLSLVLAGCATNAQNMTAPSASQPWIPQGNEKNTLWRLASPPPESSTAQPAFTIPAIPEQVILPNEPNVDPKTSYRLPELIDLAQRINPATRAAWQKAKQAALAVGMVESTYLPILTASVIGGRQTTQPPLPLDQNLKTTTTGTTQILALKWLVFDFGGRQALDTVAKHNAIAANILFNGRHQELIFAVSQAYYLYSAAVKRREFAETALNNAKAIQAAVQARKAQGLATSVETAQANQAVAQATLRRVLMEGQERDAYQNLLMAVGVHQNLTIDTQGITSRPLPAPTTAELNGTLNTAIRQALAKRPDVAASYAALEASEASINAVRADFLPKVYAVGSIARGRGTFDISGLPAIGQQGAGNAVFLGMSLPLFDGGMRHARLKEAESRAALAKADFDRIQNAALTEIILAQNALRTALESYRAASTLEQTAAITYDAALDAYRHGVGTVDIATAADTALLNAQQAKVDAHTNALIGALKLAFVVGALTAAPQTTP